MIMIRGMSNPPVSPELLDSAAEIGAATMGCLPPFGMLNMRGILDPIVSPELLDSAAEIGVATTGWLPPYGTIMMLASLVRCRNDGLLTAIWNAEYAWNTGSYCFT
jgi:hypothetical protein